jgi:hypothetical protein
MDIQAIKGPITEENLGIMQSNVAHNVVDA